MRYISTRGGVAPLSFSEAVMMGLAADGGLLIPESIPRVDESVLRVWSGLDFPALAVDVMALFTGGDLEREDLWALVQRSYHGFSHPEVTPLVFVGRTPILELFHGPTAAFKDVALQFLGNLFELLLERHGGRLNILGATSGDTGSAAIAGVRGKARIHIFILHPYQRISPVQERQMTTVLDANVHNIAIRGSFDDGQRIVKALFNDLSFKHDYQLGSINSINWVRILAQTVYYFYAWGRISKGDPSRRVSFSVPTGNFGDIFAGYLAMRMGLPVERMILATNRNDILTRFMATGIYRAGEVHPTLSPSMDIQIASNFERYLYYLMDEDAATLRTLMTELGRRGELEVSAERLARAREVFFAMAVSDQETIEQMRATYQASGYILDPHTAVGVRAAVGLDEAICLATAHPAKFGGAVRQAIGREPPPPPVLQGLLDKETRSVLLEADPDVVRAFMLDVLRTH